MSEHQTNAIDPTTAQRFVGELDRCDEELLTLRGEYMQRCKTVRERKADWMEQAADAGLPRAGLKHYLKERKLLAAVSFHRQEAEPEVIETADMIREALGDFSELPLGGAAVEAVERMADAGVTSMSINGDTFPLAKKRGRPSKKAEVPLAGQDDGTDPLSKIGRGLN